jgi:opacity protein-like surface antigen
MKKDLIFALFLILALSQAVSASGGDQLAQLGLECQPNSIIQFSATGSIDDTLLPSPADHKDNAVAPQDEPLHQVLSTNLEEKSILLDVFNAGESTSSQNITTQQPSMITAEGITPIAEVDAYKDSRPLTAQAETDELSHQALTTVIREKDNFYYVKIGGAVPLLDKTFRKFLDYGASVSCGVGQKINENLSLTVALDVMMLTGDWSISGSRESVEVASESWNPMTPSQGGQTTITAENQNPVNEGISYSSGGTYQITSSESLKQIDVHTDLYIFPITFNALYKFDQIGKISPYVGGGLGFCMATRDSDSSAIKEKYFAGPDYIIFLNNHQTVTGMLLQLLGGMSIPIYNRLKFVAEADTTWYDLKAFDPILQISMATTPTPPTIGGNDVTTYSYENPKHFGVFNEMFVVDISVGFVMPF